MVDFNLIAPLNFLGYGVAGYNILRQMYKSGNRVSFFPIGKSEWNGDDGLAEMLKQTKENAQFYNRSAPCIRIWHQFELDYFVGNGQRIGFPIFELNKFDDREKHHLSNVDALFVCSEWAKSVIEENEINVPTFVVPLGVNSETFFYDENERLARPAWTRQSTVFINVGKWEKRKGHEELCEAFAKAFSPGDDVELWMLNENDFIGPQNDEWKRKYVNTPMGNHVKFFPRFDNPAHLKKLFSHVDCGVFPSHAEGWNLEIPELMACGAHIIATNYSGHTEYLNDENALLIEPNGMESANDGKWFRGQGEWCTFDIDELVAHMRTIHTRKQNGTLGTNEAGLETAKQFTWANTVEKISDAVSVAV